MTCPECETRNAQVLPGYGECQTCLKARMVAIIETESASKGARELDDIRVRDAAMDQPGEQEFAAIAFIDRRRLLKRHDALLAQVERLTNALREAEHVFDNINACANGSSGVATSPRYDPRGLLNYCIAQAGGASTRIEAALAGTDKENRP